MNPSNVSRPHLFGLLAGLALTAGLVFTALVFANAWIRIAESQVINVTGSARKNVRSDLVVWRSSFYVDAPTLLEAQEELHVARAKIAAFFKLRGVENFVVSPIRIHELTVKQRDDTDGTTADVRVGYQLSQVIAVHSPDIDGVPRLAGDSGELLRQGVTFMSGDFEFIYTKAGEAKVEMMAEATKDARTRADQIATQGGRRLKELRNARMGVVQINPLYSSSTSWQGNNDTSSVDKTIIATVTTTFAMK